MTRLQRREERHRLTDRLQAYVQSGHIQFPEGVDLIAILLFSLSGVLAAMRRRYDIVGVFLLALVTGAGGGLIRDGLFLQQGPPALTRNWRFLPAVLGACIVGWIVNHWVVRLGKVIAVLDAVGLSMYSMVGLIKSLELGLSAPASVLVGVVNAAGGGLLRDIFTGEEPLLFKPGQFYVLASFAGCVVFVCLAYEAAFTPLHAVQISMIVIFVLRVLAIRFNWRTAPMQPWFTAGSAAPPDTEAPGEKTEPDRKH